MPSPQTANIPSLDAAPRKPAGTRAGRGPTVRQQPVADCLQELRSMIRLELTLGPEPAAERIWIECDRWAAGYARQVLRLPETHPLCLS